MKVMTAIQLTFTFAIFFIAIALQSCEKEGYYQESSVIDRFFESKELGEFKVSYPVEFRLVDKKQAFSETNINPIIKSPLTTVHLPVIKGQKVIGVILGYFINDTFLIAYQDNTQLILNENMINGTAIAFLFKSDISIRFKVENNVIVHNSTKLLRQTSSASNLREQSYEGRFECAGNVMDRFDDCCTGSCKFWCRVSNIFGGSCEIGTAIGALFWCDAHTDGTGYHSERYNCQ